ncbi:MAG: ABC transporter substrate-binding protein [Phycisphaerales bacterium]
MQNRFGLKDFVLLVLILGVGVSVWLAMFQRGREWDRLQDLNSKISAQEAALGRLERAQSDQRQLSADDRRAIKEQLDQLTAGRQELVQIMAGLSTKLDAVQSGATDAAETQRRLDDMLARINAVSASAPAASSAAGGARDSSWARPGVEIQWQPDWDFATDPRSLPGFREGGEFTETFEAQPAKITPVLNTDVYGRRIIDLVVQSLGAYDPKTLKLRGVLADAWQVDPDGLWLRAHIRPDAKFSDGIKVTSEDVRWSFHDFIMNPQIEAERDRSYLRDSIKKVEVIDELTVEFTFFEPLFLNADNALGLFVMPAHFYSTFSPAELNKATGLLMGSGPYKLERLTPGNEWSPPAPVVLVRNEFFWGRRSPIATMRFKAIDNELARLTDYSNGGSDMVTPSAPQFVSKRDDKDWRKTTRNLDWVNMRSGRSGIIWNCGGRGGPTGKPTPFADKRVRQAMTLLLDREKMVRDIWKNVGVVAKGFNNPGTPGSDPDLKPWPYDPARAKALLKDAGWEDRDNDRILENRDGQPFVFELTTFGGGEIAERIGVFVKDACAAAGIRVNIRAMDWSVGEPVRQQRDFDAMMMGWGANAPESDPKQIFHSDSINNQGDNFGQWNCPESDALIERARRELDPAKRAELWRAWERVMHDEQPYTWVRVQPWVRFVKADVGNVNMYPKGLELWEFFRGGAAAANAGN